MQDDYEVRALPCLASPSLASPCRAEPYHEYEIKEKNKINTL
jgi:hypothetical protein